jgi:pimeloyl-ACP methyl ester carboxylesterase
MTRSEPTQLRRADVRLPTNATTPEGSEIHVAMTVVADPTITGPRIVCFAFPGGGYGRLYFDLHRDELAGPSQAEFHAQRGVIFIACDPFGAGESTELKPKNRSLEVTVRAWDHAARAALRALADGSLVDWLPTLQVTRTVAIGHSLGGMQLIAHQARHETFDALAILGWSAVHTTVPTRDGALMPAAQRESSRAADLEDAWSGPMVDELEHIRYAYHWDDVPDALVEQDMSAGFPTRHDGPLPPWITRTFPPFAAVCLTPGIVSREAASITVPVFVALGERDVAAAVQGEATAYTGASDITLLEIPRAAHMHNFSPQRGILWQRLQAWLETQGVVAGTVSNA